MKIKIPKTLSAGVARWHSRSPARLVGTGLFLAFLPPVSADTLLSVDWDRTGGPIRQEHGGLNIWAGMEPGYSAAHPVYEQNMDYFAPRSVRLHAGNQITEGHQRGWIDYATKSWDASRINAVLDSLPGTADHVIMTITGWPAWMEDPDNSKRLDPAKVQDYAAFCADLVAIAGAHPVEVRFWEPFNEKDDEYRGDEDELAAIHRACYDAMKAEDGDIEVGAAAWQVPWQTAEVRRFLQNLDNKIDFFSYHQYGLFNAANSDEEMIDSYQKLLSWADTQGDILREEGYGNLPVYLDETNGFATWNLDVNERRMAGEPGLVFDALVYKHLIEQQEVDGIWHWNEADGIYGKMGNESAGHELRPAGHLYHLMARHLGEWFVESHSADAANVDVFAMIGGPEFSVLAVNRSTSAQTVDLDFGGWSPSNDDYVEHTVNDGELTSDDRSWAGPPQNLSLAPRSVKLFVFNDSSGSVDVGRQPFNGSPLDLPGRLEAEDYDTGGEHLAYSDTTSQNTGGAYRNDRVDLFENQAGDDPGEIRVDNVESGEFLNYTVDVEAGTYQLDFRVSSKWSTSVDSLRVTLDGSEIARVGPISKTWDDEKFTTVSVQGVDLTGGEQELRIEFLTDGLGLNWIDFTRSAEPAPQTVVYTFESDGNDDFDAEGGAIQTYNMQVSTASADAPEGGSFTSLSPTGNYTKYAYAFGAAVDKSAWAGNAITFEARTNDGAFEIFIEDGSNQKSSLKIGNYGATDGSWQSFTVPLSDFSGVDLGQLTAIGFGRTWSTSNALDIDHVRVTTTSAPPASKVEMESYDRKSSQVIDVANAVRIPNNTTGQWLEYNGMDTQAANYDLTIRYATYWGGESVNVKLNSQTIATFSDLRQTWGDDYFREETLAGIAVPSVSDGTLRVEPDDGRLTMDFIRFQ